MSFRKGYILGILTVPAIRATGKAVKKIRVNSKERAKEREILNRLQYHFDHDPAFEEAVWETDREIYWSLKHKRH